MESFADHALQTFQLKPEKSGSRDTTQRDKLAN